MTTDELVYLGRDNEIRRRVMLGDQPMDLSAVTRVEVSVAGATRNSDEHPTVVAYAGADIVLRLGDIAALQLGRVYPVAVVLIDPQHPRGRAVETFRIRVQ